MRTKIKNARDIEPQPTPHRTLYADTVPSLTSRLTGDCDWGAACVAVQRVHPDPLPEMQIQCCSEQCSTRVLPNAVGPHETREELAERSGWGRLRAGDVESAEWSAWRRESRRGRTRTHQQPATLVLHTRKTHITHDHVNTRDMSSCSGRLNQGRTGWGP